MDREPQALELEILCQHWSWAGCSDYDGCQQEKIGSRVSGVYNTEAMVLDREGSAHKCPGAESSGVGSKVIQNLWQGSRVRLRLDNMTAVAQILKMFHYDAGDLGMCTLSWEHNYCSVHAWQRRVWRLDPQVFKASMRLFLFLQVDLFADRLNHQLTRFWSWRPENVLFYHVYNNTSGFRIIETVTLTIL